MIKHLVWIGSMSLSTGAMAQSTVPADHGGLLAKVTASDEVAALLQTPVTVRIDRASASAKVHIAYSPLAIDTSNKVVTLTTTKAPLGRTVEHILSGTSFRLVALPGGRLAITPREVASASSPRSDTSSSAQTQTVGGVIGRVLDSTTQHGIAGVTVTVVNTKLSAVTKADGSFRITNIPAGQQALLLKLLGYQSKTSIIKVEGNKIGSVVVRLQQMSTTLTEVVTTATGIQRRLEVPTDVTRLNVDSIMKVAPISSVTDLLEMRVPGLQVQRTSGTPGDPARLRLRGVSSVNASNQPVVIVDGVRVYSPDGNTNGARSSLNAVKFAYAAPSPLDQIDPNTIATIEVFKGPSASSMYGSDAANGVIVITTKRGRPDRTRMSMTLTSGFSQIPGRYPENAFRFGHFFNQGSQLCRFDEIACSFDSLVMFQAMNDPMYSPLGSGASESGVSTSVSGGSPTVLYAFTGSASTKMGISRLPGLVSRLYRETMGSPAPGWMVRPDRYSYFGASNSTTMTVTPTIQVNMQHMVSRSRQQRSSLGATAAAQLLNKYIDPATIGREGAAVVLGNFHEQVLTEMLSSQHSLMLAWQVNSSIPINLTAGINPVNEVGTTYMPGYLPAVLVGVMAPKESFGTYGTSQRKTEMSSFAGNTTIPITLAQRIKLMFAVGGDWRQQRGDKFSGWNDSLSKGVRLPSKVGGNLEKNAVATYGWYAEPRFSLGSRVFLQSGLRLDGGSASGGRAGLSGNPKLGISWLALDPSGDNHEISGWGLSSVISQMRLRAAFGKAGVEPLPNQSLRLWYFENGTIDGGQSYVPAWRDLSMGNTKLRPERASEFEGGADLEMFSQRMSLSGTWYRKIQREAIMPIILPYSLGASSSEQFVNIGDILNTGYEISVNAHVLDLSVARWTLAVLLSHRTNRLTRMGSSWQDRIGTGIQKPVVGYPVDGFWGRPVLGFADLNDNGVLEVTELALADSSVYRGTAEPRYTAVINSAFDLFNGRVQLSTSIGYKHQMAQYNNYASYAFESAANGPKATLMDQAVANSNGLQDASSYYLTQPVNVLRFESAVVSVTLPASLLVPFRFSHGTLALRGSNLGLRTGYRGLDPNVNAYSTGNLTGDYGQIPQPRVWSLQFSLSR